MAQWLQQRGAHRRGIQGDVGLLGCVGGSTLGDSKITFLEIQMQLNKSINMIRGSQQL